VAAASSSAAHLAAAAGMDFCVTNCSVSLRRRAQRHWRPATLRRREAAAADPGAHRQSKSDGSGS